MLIKWGLAKHDTSIKQSIHIYNSHKWLYESQRYGETYQLDAFFLYSASLLLHWCGEFAQHLPSFWAHSHAQQLVRQDPGKLPPKVIERRFTGCWHVISIFRLQEICYIPMWRYVWVDLNVYDNLKYVFTVDIRVSAISTRINPIMHETGEPIICSLHPYSCVNYGMHT